MRKIICCVLIIALMLSAVACANGNDNQTTLNGSVSADVATGSQQESTEAGANVTGPLGADSESTIPEDDTSEGNDSRPTAPQEPDMESTEPGDDDPEENDQQPTDPEDTAPQNPPPSSEPGASAYKVAQGCIYVMKDGTVRVAGEYMPAKSSKGDEYITKDYTYKYGYYYSHDFVVKWSSFIYSELDGWGVKVNDQTKTSYAPMETSINGVPLVSVRECFYSCENMTQSPKIPDSVKEMVAAFEGCVSMKAAPELPKSVVWMRRAFANCRAIMSAPVLPAGITEMEDTFADCSSLVNVGKIPDGITNLSGTFARCTALTSAPNLPQTVVNLRGTFAGCTALTKAPVIHDGVEDITSIFINCTSLLALPDVPGSVREMSHAFGTCSSVTQPPHIAEGPVAMFKAFAGCSGLRVAPKIPKTAEDITYLFMDCTSIRETPAIPEGIKKLNAVFLGCTALEEAPVIPSSVTSMNEMFSGCASLKKAPVIPKNVTSIAYAFEDCKSLTGTIEIHANLGLERCGGGCFSCRGDENNCLYCRACFGGGGCFFGTTQLIVITGSCSYKEELALTGGAFVMADEINGEAIVKALDIVLMGQQHENIYNAPDYIYSGEQAVPGEPCAFRIEQTCYIEIAVESQIGVEAVEILGARINGKECTIYQTETEAEKDALMSSTGYVEDYWKSLVVYLVLSPEIEAVVSDSYTYADVVYETDCRVYLECGYTVDITIVQDQVFFVDSGYFVTTPDDY